jgi:hypothetical protein
MRSILSQQSQIITPYHEFIKKTVLIECFND